MQAPVAEEPDAVWNVTVDQTNWVDHSSLFLSGCSFSVYPAFPARLNVEISDTQVVEMTNTGAATPVWDSMYFLVTTAGVARITGCSFSSNGNFAPSSVGTGGTNLWCPADDSMVATYELSLIHI